MNGSKGYIITVVMLSLALLASGAVGFAAVFHYRTQYRLLRNQLTSARARNSDIERTIAEFDRRTNAIYGKSYSSIDEIREAVALLQDYINDLVSDINCAGSDPNCSELH